MMPLTHPRPLRPGDQVRVVAPSRSLAIIGERERATPRLEELGLRVTFGAHVEARDAFDSSPVLTRVADLHAAFADPEVAGILTVIGGYNSNQLLPHLDFDLIAANPKVFCGYSDITALHNAILARSGLVTYSGPHWSTFGMRDHLDETVAWFRRALFTTDDLVVEPAAEWTDDAWYLDQDDRHPQPNDGWWVLAPGTASGRLVGGNLCTLNLLQGSPNLPSLRGAVLFVEDDLESQPHDFDRDLQSLLQLPEAAEVTGLVIGRFQRASGMTRELLTAIVAGLPNLDGKPVVANADFGHTSPLLTFPVGGDARLEVAGDGVALSIARGRSAAA